MNIQHSTHRTILIIVSLNPQTNMIALLQLNGGERKIHVWKTQSNFGLTLGLHWKITQKPERAVAASDDHYVLNF